MPITFDSGYAIPGSGVATSIKLQAAPGSSAQMQKVFSLTPGANYTFRLWADTQGGGGTFWFIPMSMTAASGANHASDSINGGESAQQLAASVTADGTGLVTLTIKANSGIGGFTSPFWVSGLPITTGGGAAVAFGGR
jgi:hypothetical protein